MISYSTKRLCRVLEAQILISTIGWHYPRLYQPACSKPLPDHPLALRHLPGCGRPPRHLVLWYACLSLHLKTGRRIRLHIRDDPYEFCTDLE